jgi:hypothetical protein
LAHAHTTKHICIHTHTLPTYLFSSTVEACAPVAARTLFTRSVQTLDWTDVTFSKIANKVGMCVCVAWDESDSAAYVRVCGVG